jgi:uncharacterized protein (DUF1697 family)
MITGRHVALLRGINVGGSHVIRMADLRRTFEALGFADVATYIQSGNVVFASRPASKARLTAAIERGLGEAFDYDSRVVVVSARELERVVAQAPAGFGEAPGRYRYDVAFVRAPVTPAEALGQVTTRPGVDTVHAGDHALYFRRLTRRAAQSHLTRLIRLPVYKSLTLRNWNTTTHLLALVSG